MGAWRDGRRLKAQIKRAYPLQRGERVLAWSGPPPVVATSFGLWSSHSPCRLGWDEIDRAEWRDRRLTIVGSGGASTTVLDLERPRSLPGVVRTAVEAAVVFRGREPLRDGRGVRLVCRRCPRTGALRWDTIFEAAGDADDPELQRQAAQALAALQRDLGV